MCRVRRAQRLLYVQAGDDVPSFGLQHRHPAAGCKRYCYDVHEVLEDRGNLPVRQAQHRGHLGGYEAVQVLCARILEVARGRGKESSASSPLGPSRQESPCEEACREAALGQEDEEPLWTRHFLHGVWGKQLHNIPLNVLAEEPRQHQSARDSLRVRVIHHDRQVDVRRPRAWAARRGVSRGCRVRRAFRFGPAFATCHDPPHRLCGRVPDEPKALNLRKSAEVDVGGLHGGRRHALGCAQR
mmetsp:Transcript_79919/g.208415  ORF Transcript_79919/g.208415 Transcript_79919/m.208415 type:complete len:242 (-) Transcript_79919:686-1411(-)